MLKLKKTTDRKIIVIPNFSIGAAYQKLFAASLSENFDSVNITEKHHGKKQDAPSGTAIDLANYLPSELISHENPQGMQAFAFNTRKDIFKDKRVRKFASKVKEGLKNSPLNLKGAAEGYINLGKKIAKKFKGDK